MGVDLPKKKFTPLRYLARADIMSVNGATKNEWWFNYTQRLGV